MRGSVKVRLLSHSIVFYHIKVKHVLLYKDVILLFVAVVGAGSGFEAPS